MIPPLVRRCRECGHIGPSWQFARDSDESGVAVCPACHHRFGVIDDPRLN